MWVSQVRIIGPGISYEWFVSRLSEAAGFSTSLLWSVSCPVPCVVPPSQNGGPHEFLEALMPLKPEVRRMFSGFGVYVGDRIVFMLRDHEKSPRDNGVWLVLSDSTDAGDPELRRGFPSLRPIELLRNKIGHWLLIPSDSPNFEMEALHACDLLLRRDPRLGRIPESRR